MQFRPSPAAMLYIHNERAVHAALQLQCPGTGADEASVHEQQLGVEGARKVVEVS